MPSSRRRFCALALPLCIALLGGQCSDGGLYVGGADITEFRAYRGKDRAGSDCGTSQTVSCDRFDLDNRGDTIDATDEVLARMLFAQPPGPACEGCTDLELGCQGDACP